MRIENLVLSSIFHACRERLRPEQIQAITPVTFSDRLVEIAAQSVLVERMSRVFEYASHIANFDSFSDALKCADGWCVLIETDDVLARANRPVIHPLADYLELPVSVRFAMEVAYAHAWNVNMTREQGKADVRVSRPTSGHGIMIEALVQLFIERELKQALEGYFEIINGWSLKLAVERAAAQGHSVDSALLLTRYSEWSMNEDWWMVDGATRDVLKTKDSHADTAATPVAPIDDSHLIVRNSPRYGDEPVQRNALEYPACTVDASGDFAGLSSTCGLTPGSREVQTRHSASA